MKCGETIFGGDIDIDNLYFSPTIMENVKLNSPLMTEEIFGPILPVIEYEKLDHAVGFINSRPKPLALYFFSKDKDSVKTILNNTSSGGCTINDTLMHVTNKNLPFGGVGKSGMGKYHGYASFKAFSHEKSILIASNLIDPDFRYPPYSKRKRSVMGFFMGAGLKTTE